MPSGSRCQRPHEAPPRVSNVGGQLVVAGKLLRRTRLAFKEPSLNLTSALRRGSGGLLRLEFEVGVERESEDAYNIVHYVLLLHAIDAEFDRREVRLPDLVKADSAWAPVPQGGEERSSRTSVAARPESTPASGFTSCIRTAWFTART
jgi:hypothetical protein